MATTEAAKAAIGSNFRGDIAVKPIATVVVTAVAEIAPKLKIRFLFFMLSQPFSSLIS